MIKTTLKVMAAAIGLSFGVAHAGFITVGGVPAGADGQKNPFGFCTIDFNASNATNPCGATYTGQVASNFPTGSNNVHASPAGDTTAYLTVGPTEGGPITVTLGTKANYFGFFTGSLDSYNLVQFFLGATQVDQFTGTDINAIAFGGVPTGDRTQSAYVNYFSTNPGGQQVLFDRIVYSSSQNAFETDNHAFGVQRIPVPEPGSLALLGLGAVGLFASRRRKSVAAK